MTQDNFSTKIENFISRMPSLPVSAGKVLEVCNKPTVNPSELGQVISLDPVLTARLLKLINSAFYGLSTHITSVVRAITMLGLNTVKNLALSTAVLGALPSDKGMGLNMEGYWSHCLSVAVISKLLAARQKLDPQVFQEYFTAGLLHDIGKIPLNTVYADEYMQAIKTSDLENKPLFAAENDCLGINHCQAGGMIAGAWKLDTSISDVTLHHHDVAGYQGDKLSILCNVAAADYFSIANNIGFAGNRKPRRPPAIVWENTGVNEDSFDEIRDKVFSEIEKAKIFLAK